MPSVPNRIKPKKRWIPYVVAGLLVYAIGFYSGKFGIPPRYFAAGDHGRTADYTEFFQTKRLIEERYPGKVDTQALVDRATDGLVDGLKDPYSDYLTAKEAGALQDSLSGEVEGIGVEIGIRNERLVVISPLPGSPAVRAGIKSGDRIVAVGETPTQGMTVEEAAERIRGKAGSQVRVTVQTPGERPRPLTITRAQLKAPSVNLSFRGRTAVLTVSRFGDDTSEDLKRAADEIVKRKSTGIILDLRGNPGGFLEGAVDATSLFIKKGVVVKERLKDGTEERSVSDDGRLAKLPVAVLVDQGTASAAEILAGALRDNRDVPLIGERTFGKGSVQDLIDLGDGAVLKLTIAEWLTPDNTSLSEGGLKPDVAVSSKDPAVQLQAALTELR
ncbi:MAG: S41 family peptidase [bacterium]|nr:S41 family peptidase [bacterium]MDZ4247669.1 S41 family peptidase [Patescibacteria group bacterium]